MLKLIMFDIDGTLIRTDAEDRLFVEAMRKWLGIDAIDTDWNSYEHVTDAGIATELYFRVRQELPQSYDLDAACDLFLEEWTRQLSQDQSACAATEGAVSLLREALEKPDISLAIATGGWGKTARLKLEHAGLLFAEVAMASSSDALAREGIMQLACMRATEKAGVRGFDGVVYVGDGPWDLTAARNLGYGFVGVRTGERGEELIAAGARHIIADFRDARAVIELMLGEARRNDGL
jgi:phosphoglycolate phosphatase-like HAD superfamily hydrolase